VRWNGQGTMVWKDSLKSSTRACSASFSSSSSSAGIVILSWKLCINNASRKPKEWQVGWGL